MILSLRPYLNNLKTIANPEEFELTEQGRVNADVYGDGVTLMDALTIQEMSLNKNNA